nr:MAG TPA: hypothetical protein [Caudoviricetes sp.]
MIYTAPFFMYIRACVPADPPLCVAIGIRHSNSP